MAELQRADSNLQPIFHYLEKGELPADEKEARKLVLESSQFSIVDSVMYFADNSLENWLRLAAPTSIHEKLLAENRSGMFSSHFSVKSLYEKLTKRYWWKGCMPMLIRTARAASLALPTKQQVIAADLLYSQSKFEVHLKELA